MFNYRHYLESWMNIGPGNPIPNDIPRLDFYPTISVSRNFDPITANTWFRCLGVHYLTGVENHGQHNLFVDVVDLLGIRIYGMRIHIINNNIHTYAYVDKQISEPGTNFAIHWNDTVGVYVDNGDGTPSDFVSGFHIRFSPLPGDEGNSRGHHSFYTAFQLTKSGVVVPPPTEPPTSGCEEFVKRLTVQEINAIKNYPFEKIRELVK